MKRIALLALLAGGLYAALAAFGACSGDPPGMSAVGDGAQEHAPFETGGTDGPKDATFDYQLPAWDPVWHKTTAAGFQSISPGPTLSVDCGERCKVIASSKPEGMASRRPRASDQWAVFQVSPGRVHAVNLSTDTEYLVDDGGEWSSSYGAGIPSVCGQRAFYGIGAAWGGVMIIRDLVTAERKDVWLSLEAGTGGSSTTACNEPYLFWEHGPPDRVYRFDLRNGELRYVSGGGCSMLEGSTTGLATCAGEGWLDLIDFDKDQRIALGKNGKGAVMGGISPDGKRIGWVDFRHPGLGGELSTWLEPVAGGEVYVYEIETKTEKRITFDAPDKPSLKTAVRVAGDVVTWHSWSGGVNPTPASPLAFQYSAPVWFVRGTGAATPLRSVLPDPIKHAQPTATGVIAIWYLAADGGSNDPLLVRVAWPFGVGDAAG